MLYDDQAMTFDDRAGFPAEAVDSIARSLIGLVLPRQGDRWLEVGAGTGLLSVGLMAAPIRYVGFDRSPEMIRVFHRRLAAGGRAAQLYVADGNEPWPVDDATISVIFSSRAIHHLSVDHVVSETGRVLARGGGWMVTGTVVRPRDSIRSAMRREMRRRLEAMGYSGRSHERHSRELFTRLEERGAEHVGPIVAARWTRMVSPADSLNDWEGKEGLAGVTLSPEDKRRLLSDLHSWATQEFGDADRAIEQEEWYELEGARLNE